MIHDADLRGSLIELGFADGHRSQFHAVWLREECRCGECRHPGTLRRIVEAMSVPAELMPAAAVIADDGATLEVGWHDGHHSVFAARWLRTQGLKSQAVDDPASPDRTRGRTTWGSEILDAIPEIDHAEVVASPAASLRWLETIDDLGFMVMRNVPRTKEALRELASSIGPIRASNYGIDWEIEATITPANAVYSQRGLRVHSDLPYREVPPGIQFLLCDVSDAPGGASTLVDGYRVAEMLYESDPALWGTLTSVNVPYTYVDDDYDLRWAAPIIGLRRDGSYEIIRHAPGLMGPLDVAPDRFEEMYRAIQRFTRILEDPAFEVSIRLDPGDLLVIDNHRLLHGREPFDLGAGGRRHLFGSYVDSDDLRSRIRVLRRTAMDPGTRAG